MSQASCLCDCQDPLNPVIKTTAVEEKNHEVQLKVSDFQVDLINGNFRLQIDQTVPNVDKPAVVSNAQGSASLVDTFGNTITAKQLYFGIMLRQTGELVCGCTCPTRFQAQVIYEAPYRVVLYCPLPTNSCVGIPSNPDTPA